ncbi:cytochrome P450 [Epithele typhae]|uniref:cytochrome P450 n=1 Tax=Epithele typhae TaxID=378194 RepID=UPI002008ADBE|nr:cytochrome P450 [Epithele typhae]KAH9941870.1 cytochrome P450 [Epithele typhae]
MPGAAVLALLVLGGSWILWKVIRPFVFKSTLDRLPGPPNQSFLYGNLKQVYQKDGWAFHKTLGEYDRVCALHGKFGASAGQASKMLYVFDPLAMHAIAVKEAYVYDEAQWFLRANSIALGPGLLGTTGEQHRRQRKMLGPAFNNAHMRDMMPTFYEVIHKLRQAIENTLDAQKSDTVEINMVNWMGRVALELIGQSGLGHSFDPLLEDGVDDYGTALKHFIPALFSFSALIQFCHYMEAAIPAPFRRWVAERVPSKRARKLRGLIDTMHACSVKIFEEKKAALARGDEDMKEKMSHGKDIMSILLRANMDADSVDRLTDDELIGQMSTLIIAGMDTTSNALSMTLHFLAQHPEVQQKLREELLEAQTSNHGDDIPFDQLTSLPYLDAVCRETLRVRPPSPFRFRETREDVVLPLSAPVRARDGTLLSALPLPKGTTVFVGLLSTNTHKAHWGADADAWRPERWLAPLPAPLLDAKIPGVYSNVMTFWGGGRACIGFKFSQLEMKTVLAVLVSRFTFELTEKPIQWNIAGVIYPTVGTDTSPALPMKVGLAKKA